MKHLPPYEDYYLAQLFGQNANGSYARDKMAGHPGTDVVSVQFETTGKWQNVVAPNDAYVMATDNPEDPDPSHWKAVRMLVQDEDDPNTVHEIVRGHLSKIHVYPGQYVLKGQLIGIEGNTGEVYENGVAVTTEERLAGSKRGTHVHDQKRPCWKSDGGKAGVYYLGGPDASKMYTLNGIYFEIKNYNNGFHGCVDIQPDYYIPTPAEEVGIILRIVNWLRSKFG